MCVCVRACVRVCVCVRMCELFHGRQIPVSLPSQQTENSRCHLFAIAITSVPFKQEEVKTKRATTQTTHIQNGEINFQL